MKLRRVPRASLVESVVEQIRTGIQKNGMAPGDKLPSECELIASLKVSRSVVREAVGRLEAIGLVNVRHGSGTYVADTNFGVTTARLVSSVMTVSSRDVEEIVDLRAAFLCQSARRAAECATSEDISELKRLCEAIEAPETEQERALFFQNEFYRKIVTVAGNMLVEKIAEVIHAMICGTMARRSIDSRDVSKRRMTLNSQILGAITNRDPDAAERNMRKCLE